MMSQKLACLLSTLFLLSCGDTVRNKKKGKNRMVNGVQTLKQAKGLHRDPCDEPNACNEFERIQAEDEEDLGRYTKYMPKNTKSERDYKQGESLTRSILTLLNPTDNSSGTPVGKFCYVIFDKTTTFYKYIYDVKDTDGEVEDFLVYKNTYSDYRSLIDDPACEKSSKEYYENLVDERGLWDYTIVTEYTPEDEQEEKESEEEKEDWEKEWEAKWEEKQKQTTWTIVSHGLKYKGKLALRNEYKEEVFVNQNKKNIEERTEYLNMVYVDDRSKTGKIYDREERFNSSGATTYYKSVLLKSTSVKEVNLKDIPTDLIF